jgi:hypothetical protein
MTPPNFPMERLTALQRHLEVTSKAIAAYEPIIRTEGDGYELPDYMRAAAEAHSHLVNSYLLAREDFEKVRAQFEHDFMTWHVDTLAGTDANYRLGAPNQAPAHVAASVPGYVPPGWAEAEQVPDPVSLAAAKAAEDALSTGV